MCIKDYQKSFSHKGACKIDIYHLLELCRPHPRLQGCHSRSTFHSLTGETALSTLPKVLVKSLSTPGHHRWLCATAFILTMPGWSQCNSSASRTLSFCGITTRFPTSSSHPQWTIPVDDSSLAGSHQGYEQATLLLKTDVPYSARDLDVLLPVHSLQ